MWCLIVRRKTHEKSDCDSCMSKINHIHISIWNRLDNQSKFLIGYCAIVFEITWNVHANVVCLPRVIVLDMVDLSGRWNKGKENIRIYWTIIMYTFNFILFWIKNIYDFPTNLVFNFRITSRRRHGTISQVIASSSLQDNMGIVNITSVSPVFKNPNLNKIYID